MTKKLRRLPSGRLFLTGEESAGKRPELMSDNELVQGLAEAADKAGEYYFRAERSVGNQRAEWLELARGYRARAVRLGRAILDRLRSVRDKKERPQPKPGNAYNLPELAKARRGR